MCLRCLRCASAAGQRKRVTFTYDTADDTAESIACEMQEALSLPPGDAVLLATRIVDCLQHLPL